jgi:ABC-type polysaccharide/polyol phosphate export permease
MFGNHEQLGTLLDGLRESHTRPSTCLGETYMLLIVAIVLLIIAIAGGVIVHPLLFALAIVALVLFFTGRGATV